VRVLIFSSPRSASYSYGTLLSETHGLYDVGEPWPLYFYDNPNLKTTLEQSNELYLGNQNACMKLHSGHVAEYMPHRHRGWFQDVLNATDEIHFLLRKDTQAQIKSLFVANYYSTLVDKQDKFFKNVFEGTWQEDLVIPDTPVNRALWKRMEMLIHVNLVGLSILYHTLIDQNPKVVWTEDIVDKLPGQKYNRPVKFDWEPEYMFANDEFYPAKLNQIFAPNKDKF